jgi:hypothetical protein
MSKCKICHVPLEEDEQHTCQDCAGVVLDLRRIRLTLPQSRMHDGHAERLREHTERIRAELAREDQAEAG